MFLEHVGFVSVKNFRKFLASITLNMSFYFSSSSDISIICVFHHLHVLAFLDTLFYRFHSFFFLYISLWEFYIVISSSSLFLSLTVFNLLVSPSKVFFISATLFFDFFVILCSSLHLSTYIIHTFLHIIDFLH